MIRRSLFALTVIAFFTATTAVFAQDQKLRIVNEGPAEMTPGGTATYIVTITNVSDSKLTGIWIYHHFKNAAHFLKLIPEQSTLGCAIDGIYVSCPKTRTDTLGPRGSRQYIVTYKVPETVACGTVVIAAADVRAKQSKPDWGNSTGKVVCPTPTPTPTPTPLPESPPILPALDCVYDLGGGKYRAYFGYQNTGGATNIPAGINNADQVNAFSPGAANRGQISSFAAGNHSAAFSVEFNGQPLTWSIKPSNAKVKTVIASKDSLACKEVKPIAECRDPRPDSKFQTFFGYQNDNSFEVKLNIPEFNKFIPAPADRSQPDGFFPGRVTNAFSVVADDGLTWQLGKQVVVSDGSVPVCTPIDKPECNTTDIRNIKLELDIGVNMQRQLISRLARRLKRASDGKTNFKKLADNAVSEAELLYQEAWRTAWIGLPNEIINCSDSPSCELVDQSTALNSFDASSTRLKNIALDLLRKIRSLREKGEKKKKRNDKKYVQQANALHEHNASLVATTPRFTSQCN